MRGPDFGKGPVQDHQEPAGVVLEAGRAQFDSLAADQSGQAGRQLLGTRHPGLIYQDRDHPNIARQRGLDLHAHEVIRVIEATPPIRSGDRQPLITNHCQQHIAGPDRPGDHLNEVIAQLDRVHVLEDPVVAVPVSQPVVQPARRVGGVLPPVADVDPARRWCSRLDHQPYIATGAPASQPCPMGTGSARQQGGKDMALHTGHQLQAQATDNF